MALSTPLIAAADALGLLVCPPEELETAAVLLERLAGRYGPAAETSLNPAKALALELSGTLPVVWGTSPLAAVSAYRFACQLNENAKLPGVWGELPEAGHNQIVAFDGSFARRPDGDLFRDRLDDPADERTRMHVLLLRDADEHPRVQRRVEVVGELAADRGLALTQVVAEGGTAFARLASLIAFGDWVSVYLALLEGVDPTPVGPIMTLKERLAR
jgi:glucose/mannose-6-phosphate isomerase